MIWKFCLHYVLRGFLCFNSMQLDRNTLPKKGLRYIFLSAQLLPFLLLCKLSVLSLYSSHLFANIAPNKGDEITFNLDASSGFKCR